MVSPQPDGRHFEHLTSWQVYVMLGSKQVTIYYFTNIMHNFYYKISIELILI